MHKVDAKHLLMIHPTGAPSAEPVVDDLTRRMTRALRRAGHGDTYRGFHRCTGRGCGALSDNVDHLVGSYVTNSLAVHYLAHHRADVPPSELAKVAALDASDLEPTEAQLTGRR